MKEVKLSEISVIKPGKAFRGSVKMLPKGNTPLIQPSDLDNFDINKLPKISVEPYRLQKGDILISNRGKFRAMVLPESGDFIIPASLHLLRLKDTKIDPYFVVAIINSRFGEDQLKSLATGSYITSLRPECLADFRIPRHLFDHQRQIADLSRDLMEYRRKSNRLADIIERSMYGFMFNKEGVQNG